MGHEIAILNEATKKGNKSIADLKRLEAHRSILKLQDDINTLESKKNDLEGEIRGLHRDILTAKQVKNIPHSKSFIGDKQVIATSDFNKLCKTAAKAENLLEEIKEARIVNNKADEIIEQAKEELQDMI